MSRFSVNRWTSAAFAVAVAAAVLAMPRPASAHVPFCTQCVNPHGKNIPPAGSDQTCIPGAKTAPNAGQNPDGFFQVGTIFAGGTPNDVELFDGCPGNGGGGTGQSFGVFPTPTNIKYTEANGATPSISKIGSTNGQAGAVQFKLKGQGDLFVCEAGTSNCVCCQVPPPPK